MIIRKVFFNYISYFVTAVIEFDSGKWKVDDVMNMVSGMEFDAKLKYISGICVFLLDFYFF